jgi:eukaryotic-like serine/threonine-protein kinase
MKPDRWNEVDKILQSVLERSPAERRAYVDEVCSGDEELRREVLTLMGSHEQAGSFMASPAVEGSDVFEDGPKLKQGDSVGRYRITKPLGRGGMGEVYLAEHTTQNREVALKILPRHFLDDPQRVQRFRQEARAVLALNHPNVVTVYDIGEAAGVHYISTEFVEGQTLRARMARERLTITEAVDIGLQVAGALAYAHEKGVVHRDVKPENIMLRPDGYVKVLDFGIAKLTERRAATVTADDLGEAQTRMQVETSPGMVLGTPYYMSPEQARGKKVDERTDTWSLGVVLYEMLTGQQPFAGETPSDVISVILQRDPATLSTLLTNAPAELERIISKALDKSKDERYQTAKDFLADLRRFKRRYEHESDTERSLPPTGTALMPPGVSTDGGASATSTAGASQITSSAEYLVNEFKRHRLLLILVAVTVVTAIGFGAYQLWNRNRAGQTANVGTLQAPKLTVLPVNGKVSDGAISPDGKYVVYRLRHEAQVQEVSVWVRHLPTNTTVQIMPPTKDEPFRHSFSADSNYIYYAQRAHDSQVISANKISVLGGVPKKLIENIGNSEFAPSPDGRQMAFLRHEQSGEEKLLVSNEDGTGERLLVSRSNATEWFSGLPAWSPDGKTIACIAGSSSGGFNFSVLAVRVADGTQRHIGTTKWGWAGYVAWLGDGSGLMATAAESKAAPWQVWYISYPDGVVRRITNDLSDYGVRSVTADSKTLLALQGNTLTDVLVGPVSGDASQLKQVTFTGGDRINQTAWTPDGKIVSDSKAEANYNLWVMNADGGNRRQITNGPEGDYGPAMSADGRTVFFTSIRGGTPHIWRVDLDGSNLKQITFGPAEDNVAQPTADGKWVLFNSFRSGRYHIWKVSADGGEPVPVIDICWLNAQSPDGKLMACTDAHQQSGRAKVFIVPVDGGEPTNVLELPQGTTLPVGWTTDGRALTFLKSTDSTYNIWILPLDGSRPKQLTHFSDPSLNNFWGYGLSRDGKLLAVTRSTQSANLVLITDFK